MMTDTETMNDILSRMPWTRDQLTRAQLDEWLASRRDAGRVIDIETCEIGRWQAYDSDPYGARSILPAEMKQMVEQRRVPLLRLAEQRDAIARNRPAKAPRGPFL